MKDARTRLLLLRHGEVEARYQRVFGGRIDMDLSPHGLEQARQLAQFLEPVHLDGLYVSPMKRAQQSVAPLAALNGGKPATLEGLREVDFGDWTGLHWDQVRERYAVTAFDWLRELERGGIPQAETVPAFNQRVGMALDHILAVHPGQVVAIMCHGGVIRMLLSILLELPLPRMASFEIDYASVSIVDHRPRKTEVQLLNFTPWRSLP